MLFFIHVKVVCTHSYVKYICIQMGTIVDNRLRVDNLFFKSKNKKYKPKFLSATKIMTIFLSD